MLWLLWRENSRHWNIPTLSTECKIVIPVQKFARKLSVEKNLTPNYNNDMIFIILMYRKMSCLHRMQNPPKYLMLCLATDLLIVCTWKLPTDGNLYWLICLSQKLYFLIMLINCGSLILSNSCATRPPTFKGDNFGDL